MVLKTKNFGVIDVDNSKIITFSKGILGFPQAKNFVILDNNEKSLLKWMQSVELPNLAFVITNPLLFKSDYVIDIYKKDLEELKAESLEDIAYFVVVTVPKDPSKMTANMKGPIIINTKNYLGKQLILDNSQYDIKYKLMREDSQNVVNFK